MIENTDTMTRNDPQLPTSTVSIPPTSPPAENPSAGENHLPDPPSQTTQPDTADLSSNQLAAIDLLLAGQSCSAVADALSIGRKTLYNWRTNHAPFRQTLESRRQELYDNAAQRLRLLLDTALNTLDNQVKDPYTPTAHRAAKTILTIARLGQTIAPPPNSKRATGAPPVTLPDASTPSPSAVES